MQQLIPLVPKPDPFVHGFARIGNTVAVGKRSRRFRDLVGDHRHRIERRAEEIDADRAYVAGLLWNDVCDLDLPGPGGRLTPVATRQEGPVGPAAVGIGMLFREPADHPAR